MLKTLQNIIDDFNRMKEHPDVYIVANVVGKTIKDSRLTYKHSSNDEFFSREEFAEIASAITNVCGFTKSFYSEIELIEYILNNKMSAEEFIVYNLARDGSHSGKKSLIPAFCDLVGIKYTGSDAFVISLLREKFIFSSFLNDNGVKTPPSFKYNMEKSAFENKLKDKKVIAKNINESASIGLDESNIFDYNEKTAIQTLNGLCIKCKTNELLVQEYIEGKECEVLVLKYKGDYIALDPVYIKINGDRVLTSIISNTYDYSFFSDNIENNRVIMDEAIKAAKLLGIKNYARFDFRVLSPEKFYLIDIAGTPYTIRHSSVSYLFTEMYKLQYQDIYKVIIACLLNN